MSSIQRKLAGATVLAVGFLAIGLSSGRSAGSNAAEESAIRKFIAAADGDARLPSLPDRIFWSGAYKGPTVGSEQGEPKSGPGAISDRVPGSRKDKTEVIRIVIADNRDLAYEYSKSTLSFDLKSGEHRSFDTGLLRVWQKQGGDWKVAAFFVRPYDE